MRRRIIIALLCWVYLLFILALIAVIRVGGDRSWPATLLIFGPRWPVLFPLGVLIPLVLWGHRQMWRILAGAVLAAVFPLMGFNIGWHRWTPQSVAGFPIRVVAFNLHHHDLKTADAQAFFDGVHADIVTLEELPAGFNHNLFPHDSWHVYVDGELGIASRFPITTARPVMPGTASYFRLQAPGRAVNLIVVHFSSPHYALRDTITGAPQGPQDLMQNIRERTVQSDLLRQIIAHHRGPLIIAGDFNLAFDSQLFSSGFSQMTDSFKATGFGFGWTYRNGWTDVRIDHVVSDSSFGCLGCRVGPFLGSPHRPVIADLILKSSQ